MIGVSLLALAANVTCLLLVQRHRHQGAHMEASAIFSANDVLANLGVIAAGALVAWTGSPAPDLVIGAAIAALVLRGAVRILSALAVDPQSSAGRTSSFVPFAAPRRCPRKALAKAPRKARLSSDSAAATMARASSWMSARWAGPLKLSA